MLTNVTEILQIDNLFSEKQTSHADFQKSLALWTAAELAQQGMQTASRTR
jgi:hypothetical protein